VSTSKEEKLVLWFEELTKDDIPIVGGKNANLGEMTQAGIPVPPGFAVTAQAYRKFISFRNIKLLPNMLLSSYKRKLGLNFLKHFGSGMRMIMQLRYLKMSGFGKFSD